MTKHTPGPWTFLIDKLGSKSFVVSTAQDSDVPICQIMRASPGNGNSHLIAAAPELLEACKAALATETFSMTEENARIALLLMNAVKKAEGKKS